MLRDEIVKRNGPESMIAVADGRGAKGKVPALVDASAILLAFVKAWIVHALYVLVLFFQAEDGIRDLTVTGVQTCALPIYHLLSAVQLRGRRDRRAAVVPGVGSPWSPCHGRP